jgi:hypothetical protein
MNVKRLERESLKHKQAHIDLIHHLSGGMYSRTGVIPAGHTLTGATHKTDHFSILFGDVTITLDNGVKRLTGHHVLPTKAGMKRAIYAHIDTMMTTICRTDLTDLQAIENELVCEPEALQTRLLGTTELIRLE